MNGETEKAVRRWLTGACLVVFALCWLLYANSLFNGFCYDDLVTIENNFFIRSWKNLPKLFHRDYFLLSAENSYRPLVTFTYFLDYTLYGLKPSGYHASNVFFHAAAAAGVVLLFSSLISLRTGFFLGLLFAVFPLNSEAVNAVSFREDILVLFFGLVCFLLYLRWRKTEKFWWLVGSGLTSLLACLAKENGVVIPALIMAREAMEEKTAFFQRMKKPLFTYVAVLIGYSVLRFLIFPGSGKDKAVLLAKNYAVTLLDIPMVYCSYLKKLIWPYPLVAEYQVLWPVSFSWQLLFFSLTATAGWTFLLWFSWRRNRVVFFGLLWLILGLLPTSNLIPIFNPFAERYLYLPAVGFLLVLVSLMEKLRKNWRQVVVTALVATYAVTSFQRNPDWKDDVALWSKTIAQMKMPTARAYLGLGSGLRRQGKLLEAEKQLRKVIVLKPSLAVAHLALADVLADLGRYQEAIAGYRLALRLEPENALAHHNLAFTLQQSGRVETALFHYRQAIKSYPFYAEAYFNLANLLAGQGRLSEAEENYRQALKIHPAYAQAYYNLGNLLLQQQRLKEAGQCYQKAISVKPDYAAAFNNLGTVRLRMGDSSQAVVSFSQAVKLQPSSGQFHFNLALALVLNRQPEKALSHYDLALKYLPEEAGNAQRLQGTLSE
ncbi:MAG TPA: tetratricopeptide repeat protein, partial [bacterium]|nr:tetratricopeptide repeat protein [bacterium]